MAVRWKLLACSCRWKLLAGRPAPVNRPKFAEQSKHNFGETEIIRMEKLPAEEVSRVTLEVSAVPAEVHVSAMFWLEAKVTNATNSSLYPVGPYPVRLAYHWLEKTTRQTVVFDGDRSGLFPGLDAGATEEYLMTIIAPDQPGEYILQTTLVQDGICWFENIRPDILQEFVVSVTTKTAGDDSGSARMRKP
jgi:hypothetical protein